jgi:DNA-directed RNA polymerase specialized sigma24 family protein
MNAVEAIICYQKQELNINQLLIAVERDVKRIAKHFSRVFRVPELDDDIAQEILITLSNRHAADKYDPALPLDKYLATITYRIANHLSRPYRKLDSFSQFATGDDAGTDDEVQAGMRHVEATFIHSNDISLDTEIDRDIAIAKFNRILSATTAPDGNIPEYLWSSIKGHNSPNNAQLKEILCRYDGCDETQAMAIIAWYERNSNKQELLDQCQHRPWQLALCPMVSGKFLKTVSELKQQGSKSSLKQPIYEKGESHTRLATIIDLLALQRGEMAALLGIPQPRLASYLDAHVQVVPDNILRKAEDILNSMPDRAALVVRYNIMPISAILGEWIGRFGLTTQSIVELLQITPRTVKRWSQDQNKPVCSNLIHYQEVLSQSRNRAARS